MTYRLPLAALAATLTLALPATAQDVREGSFVGDSDHVTTGTASVVYDMVMLGADFSLDGAPDPRVALGKQDSDERLDLGELAKLEGAQAYAIPEGTTIEDWDRVWIWCEQFSVPLGHADLPTAE